MTHSKIRLMRLRAKHDLRRLRRQLIANQNQLHVLQKQNARMVAFNKLQANRLPMHTRRLRWDSAKHCINVVTTKEVPASRMTRAWLPQYVGHIDRDAVDWIKARRFAIKIEAGGTEYPSVNVFFADPKESRIFEMWWVVLWPVAAY